MSPKQIGKIAPPPFYISTHSIGWARSWHIRPLKQTEQCLKVPKIRSVYTFREVIIGALSAYYPGIAESMLTGKNRPIRQLQLEMKEILKIYLYLLHWIKQAAKLQQSLNRNRYLIARYELKMYNICSQSNQPTQFQINTGYAWRQQWTNVINAFHINAKQTTDVCQPIGFSVSDTHTSVSPSYHIAYCLQFDCLTTSCSPAQF